MLYYVMGCCLEIVECQGDITSVKYVSILQEGLLGRVWIGRNNNQEFDINRLQPTVKHGECYAMLWGAVWSWWSARETSLLWNMFPYCRKASLVECGLVDPTIKSLTSIDCSQQWNMVNVILCYGVLFGAGGVPGRHNFC